MATTAQKLAALDARVAALEAGRGTATASLHSQTALDPDVFWALEGLHARVPAQRETT